MSCVVTGAAGFIGSHLCEKLLSMGYTVAGIDNFSDYYSKDHKLRNLSFLTKNPKFTLFQMDLSLPDHYLLETKLLSGAEYIFHLAAQPGVRASWGQSFEWYVKDNILATQRLLEALRTRKAIKQFILASSSSVYGDAETLPTGEDVIPSPVSPYGVTKLACESLSKAYHKNFDIPIVILRYFTVYGPRQRPDMAFHRFINDVQNRRTIEIYGDGEQTRDFTFVRDTVAASTQSMNVKGNGQIYNIGSSRNYSINQVLGLMEELIGKKAKVSYAESAKGDVRNTSADISKASAEIQYFPQTELNDGLREQIRWQMETK